MAEGRQDARHVSVKSHRCLHSWFTPTHLELGSANVSEVKEPIANVSWQSRRSRKARYAPVPHVISARHTPGPGGFLPDGHTSGALKEMEKPIVHLRVQTQEHIKPHLVLDLTFWLAVTFTFGSAIWVINGELTQIVTRTTDM